MKLPTLAKVCGARNRLQAERDSLLAANVALREALQNLADYTARISPPPYEHGCMWCAGCVERLNGEVRTALANPATTEALERVRREAVRDYRERLEKHMLAMDMDIGAEVVRDFETAALRGGE